MEAKQTFIGEYINKSPRERVFQLMDHYGEFESFRDKYKGCVVSLIVMMKEYNIRPGDDDLGVRVQTTSGTSHITESKAIERYTIEECFEKRKITKKMFPDPYERELISTAIFEYDLMEKEYRILEHFYECSKDILAGLGKMYSSGGEFTTNIDSVGGSGTAEFVGKVIEIYCK